MDAMWFAPGNVLLEASIRAAILALMIALVLRLARTQSSSLVHAAWTAMLAAMLLMPLLPRIIPAVPAPVRFPSLASTVALPPFDSPGAPPPAPVEIGAQRPVAAMGATPAAGTAETKLTSAERWLPPLLTLYAAGVVVMLARLGVGIHGMRRIRESATSAGIDFMESTLVNAPVTIGVLRPAIVLPHIWREWPEDKLAAILAHERAHVSRRDPTVRILSQFNCAIFWFHPLAWWLDRKLATTAEAACDDAAVRSVGASRRYAEVLLDIADTVRRRGGRVAWEGLGVGGSGMLGRRIDRILSGRVAEEISRRRKVLVAVGCAAAIVLAGAWRQIAAPLRPHPEALARMESNAQLDAFRNAALNMSASDVAAADAAWRSDRENMEALEKLLIYYGHDFNGRARTDRAAVAATRREYILWLIEHHPEHRLAGTWGARIYNSPRDPFPDAEGHAEARRLWLMHLDRNNLPVAALSNGAAFFEAEDTQQAEAFLLRAAEVEPRAEWSRRLGRIYALAMLGSNASMPLGVLRSVSIELSRSSYAHEARNKLESSRDAVLLSEAGYQLVSADRFLRDKKIQLDFDPVQTGRAYLRRAVEIDPSLTAARMRLEGAERRDHDRDRSAVLRAVPRERWPEAVRALPDEPRFELMPQLADNEYMWAEHLDYTLKDRVAAEATWARSKQYAQDTLALASMFTDHPDHREIVFRTHIALGTHALREGDRATAVHHLLAAAQAGERGEVRMLGSLEGRLVRYLIKAGERATIIEFMEKSAAFRPYERERLLKDAAAIRAGLMTETMTILEAR
jgi:beta-lactamase regulating signal transducer with metallopeptidase domain